ncbi:MAG TPA: type 4a pilus biogenesis protein PilO [Patescibacteria group bacterium]|nr:type 4a pilus biogenesis protein PilO [Patescibacteria group bacterium]
MKLLNKDSFNAARIKYFQFLPDLKGERTQKFTTLILTFFALSFFGLFAINPTLSTIAELNKKLEDNKFIDEKLGQKIANLTALQQKYANLQPDLPIIFAAIPKSPEVPIFAALVQAIASNQNITIETLQTFPVDVNTNQNPRQYSSFSFALTADGSYNDLSNFLSSLTSMQRIVQIDIISLTKKTGTSNSLQLTLKGKTFFSQ